MRTTVIDEGELKATEIPSVQPDGEMRYSEARYVRSISDPRCLIHGTSGDVFVRKDGANWEWPAYKANRYLKEPTEVRPATAIYDSKRYAVAT